MVAVNRRLFLAAAAAAGLFGALTIAVVAGSTAAVDLVLTRQLQSVVWGPLQIAFRVTDMWDGTRQVVLALIVILIVFLLQRRLALLAVLCTGSDLVWYLLEVAIHRPRPDPHLVHVVRHATGGTYPSGHVVYYLWALLLLALAVREHLPRRVRFIPLLLGFVALAVVCLGRVVEGEHWPSDVAGGLLLGGAWTLGVLSLGWRASARSAHRKRNAAPAL